MTYAKKVLMREQRHQAENPPLDVSEEADKVFRVLDKNSDGELMADELTTGVREEKVRIDTDGNGRISKGEYRDYFKKKVTAKAESLAAKSGGERQPRTDGKADADKIGTDGLPSWFTTLDLDKDKQISLFEWRESGRPTEEFSEMDLDGDGLLTRDEYARYVKKRATELDQKRREEGK
jgi:Ca2+-binding EF-hand superfamily protein